MEKYSVFWIMFYLSFELFFLNLWLIYRVLWEKQKNGNRKIVFSIFNTFINIFLKPR